MSSCSSGETLATPRQSKCLHVSAESHLHVSAELLAANTDEGNSCYHHEVPGLPDCSDEVTSTYYGRFHTFSS